MKTTLIIASLTALAGCATVDKLVYRFDPHPMTQEQRARFNSGPSFFKGWFEVWAAECIYDKTGNAINREDGIFGCADYRMINRAKQPYRPGINLTSLEGRYIKTPVIDPADIESVEIPDDVTVVWFDSSSSVEATCAKLTTDRWKAQGIEGAEYYNKLALLEYPPACYDGAFKIIYAIYGDKPALEHELKHHRGEIGDDE